MRYLAVSLLLLQLCVKAHGAYQILITTPMEVGTNALPYFFFGTRLTFTPSDRYASLCSEDRQKCVSPTTFERGVFMLDISPESVHPRNVLMSTSSVSLYPDASVPFRVIKLPMTVTVATVAGGVRLNAKWNFDSQGFAAVWYDRLRLYNPTSARHLTWAIHSGFTDGTPSLPGHLNAVGDKNWVVSASQVTPFVAYRLQFSQYADINNNYWVDIPDRTIMFVGGNNFWLYGKSPNWIQAPNA